MQVYYSWYRLSTAKSHPQTIQYCTLTHRTSWTTHVYLQNPVCAPVRGYGIVNAGHVLLRERGKVVTTIARNTYMYYIP